MIILVMLIVAQYQNINVNFAFSLISIYRINGKLLELDKICKIYKIEKTIQKTGIDTCISRGLLFYWESRR